ncbi:MAG: type II secretion system protein GspE [Phycisphaerae bacterium]|nr:type II secretion system protein GspE [Phycisphaerae bacterium]
MIDNGSTQTTSTEADSSTGPDTAAIQARCRLLGIPWHERAVEASLQAIECLRPDEAVRLGVVPLRIEEGRLIVAMLDPLDAESSDEAATLTGMPVRREGMDRPHFMELMREHYGTTASKMADALAGEADDDEDSIEHNLDAIEADDIHRMAEEPTLINLVNLILLEAIQQRASDVHVEPFENQLTVRYRIDGVLQVQDPPPKHLQPALIGRIKIMSGMNIAERYVPQDGKISLRFEGRKVDIRVSTVPTLYGESVVMRILDKSSLALDYEVLGMKPEIRESMDSLLSKPHGMVLVTGPTGSGKTTTLYASLKRIFDPHKKIITIEDPVEYELEGINQIPVNHKRGLDFAGGLRSILRQDPDIVLVGEIRDGETADIAIRSALTGHLILSTLHTNDAPSSVGRLVDMGAEPYLVASVLEGLLAQRLGRRVCQECRVQTPIDEDMSHRITEQERALFNGKVWTGTGCEKCNNTGYRGRIGYYEILKVNAASRKAIADNVPIAEFRRIIADDMQSMREDGMNRAAEGLTSIAEVLRATQDADDTTST